MVGLGGNTGINMIQPRDSQESIPLCINRYSSGEIRNTENYLDGGNAQEQKYCRSCVVQERFTKNLGEEKNHTI